MAMKVLGIYREAEFSPGKVAEDAAILDAVLAELAREGAEVEGLDSRRFAADSRLRPDLVLAMCQGERALSRLAELEKSSALAINSALAIRNCYRDLLGAGLARAGVPAPKGVLLSTSPPIDRRALAELAVSNGVFVKRGDLHALGPEDVQRVDSLEALESVVYSFGRRGIRFVYVQQAVEGRAVKFYGVSGGEYFAALPQGGEISEAAERALARAAQAAAKALGLEAWGGDAIVSDDQCMIIDFNDWPSYSAVRGEAARAIARRSMLLLRRPRYHHTQAGK
jgi:glutathione synthase/RimK-type ligase-like ATP-grasp enzyme